MGFIAANLSMILISKAVDISNGLSAGLAGSGPSASRPPPGRWCPRWRLRANEAPS